jgi:hypothetical protein
MPIEDIDYLYENSKVDTRVVYIDSNQRDRRYYPKANRFSVRFSPPLRNVFGLDILDASVPSSMFNVDYDKNDLYYITMEGRSGVSIAALTELIQELDRIDGFASIINYSAAQEAGDYPTLTKRLYRASIDEETDPFQEDIFGNDKVSTYLIEDPRRVNAPKVDIVALNKADNSFDEWMDNATNSEKKYIQVRRTKMPSVVMQPISSQAPPTVSGDNSGDYVEVAIDGIRYRLNYSDPNNKRFVDFLWCYYAKYGNLNPVETLYGRQNPPRRSRSFRIELERDNVYNWYYYVLSASQSPMPSTPTASFWHTRMRPSNQTVNTLIEDLKLALSSAGIFLPNDLVNYIQEYPYMRFQATTPFIFNMHTSTIGDVLGFDEYPTTSTTTKDRYTHVVLQNNMQMFGSVKGSKYFEIQSHGVLNLANARYTILRCEELESHIYGSYSFGSFTPGIGIFRFFDNYSPNHERQDYINIEKKPFHPLGKLDKITFSFILPDGINLYDFKGLNLLLILSIKYYMPSQTHKIERSVLNPNYDKNFRNYLYTYAIKRNEMNDDDNQSSEEDNAVENESLRTQLLQIQSKYDYDSD